MTIEFRVRATATERVGFSYSPASQAVLSLHVLVQSKHHLAQHPWVRATRGLPPALKREIDAFTFAFRTYVLEFLFPATLACGARLGFVASRAGRSLCPCR
ncbi:DUF5937 family protein [Streptomyces sp. NPDC050508]|uniref:DUF5937 family protein n=1 Tax=Streptomyces sp. NPDC050508 TaxID=3155405 RepID=UPI00343FDD31